MDGRNQPIRGLWVRNGRFYARVAVENADTGKTTVRRVPLESARTMAEARKALGEVDGQAGEQRLACLATGSQIRRLRANLSGYLATVVDAKSPATVAKEGYSLRR